MCGRFSIVMNKNMVALVDELGVPVQFAQQHNIAPTEAIPVIMDYEGQRGCNFAKWWFTPSWSKEPDSTKYSMFNARSEGLDSSRAFKGSFRHHRCVIPASAFLEWQKTETGKQAYEIFAPKQALLFAGIYELWGGEMLTAAIVTTKAAPEFARIHNRMPVMLTVETAQQWLNEASDPRDLKTLFASKLPYSLTARPVHQAINNARSKLQAEPVGEQFRLS